MYAVSIRHYGMDARELERNISIALEDALYAIDGVKSVQSTSENGSSRVLVRFFKKQSGNYESVRDAAQRVYETLPRSVQRPEIVSSGDSRVPLWFAAVFFKDSNPAVHSAYSSIGSLLERTVKPVLERIEGAGAVELYGCGVTELNILLDTEAAAARGLDAASVAAFAASRDLLVPGGYIREDSRDTLLVVDGRYTDAHDMAGAWITRENGIPVLLSDIALVEESEREADTLSRLNGRPAAVIAVMGGASADPAALSRSIQHELASLKDLPLEFMIISDRGAEEKAALHSVVRAAIQGAVAVALCAVLLSLLLVGKSGPGRPDPTNKKHAVVRSLSVGLLSVPCIALFTLALLSLLGFPPGRIILASLAAGLGAAVDASILCIERVSSSSTRKEAGAKILGLIPSLFSGTFTTIIVLFPLVLIPEADPSVYSVALAIGCCSVLSLVFALVLLPPFLVPASKENNAALLEYWHQECQTLLWRQRLCRFHAAVRHAAYRLLARHVHFIVHRKGFYPLVSLFLCAAAVSALLVLPLEPGSSPSEDSVHARIEFKSGLSACKADLLLADYAAELSSHECIRAVQTSVRNSSATLLASFDPALTDAQEAAFLVTSIAVPGAFIHLSEVPRSERSWTIRIFGSDDERCRELAGLLAERCMNNPLLHDAVLHFKDGRQRLLLKPERLRTAAAGLYLGQYADVLRRAVHGPPAYKRITAAGETDVRVRGLNNYPVLLSDLADLPLVPSKAAPRLSAFMEIEQSRDPSAIHREDRRRTASFSVSTATLRPGQVQALILEAAAELDVPPGYSIEFDREAMERLDAVAGLPYIFFAAILLCYMAIAAVSESFGIPLAVLSVVFPALSVPVLFLFFIKASLSITLGCAFVAAAGITVNASVLSVDALRSVLAGKQTFTAVLLYRALRKRIPVLLATTLSTAAGALPFLALHSAANTLVRSLSLVTFIGVIASFFCSISLIPSLALLFPGLFTVFSGSACAESKQTPGF